MNLYLKDSIFELLFEFLFATIPLFVANLFGIDFDNSRSYIGFSVVFYAVLVALIVAVLWLLGRLRG